MVQSFRKIKIDINDSLYSEIVRFGKDRCDRCRQVRALQCAHIVGRTAKTTRWLLEPKPNAIALCASCHDWFDTHKISAVIFDEKKRVFNSKEESFTFLFINCGYEWEDLAMIYAKSQGVMNPPYQYQRNEITKNLRSILNILENKKGESI